MNHKIEKHILIDYVYGELDAETHSYVEQVIAKDLALQAEVDELKQGIQDLKMVPDQEVHVPYILTPKRASEPKTKVMPLYYAMGIAASLALLILSASFAKIELKRDQAGWALSFGDRAVQETIVSPGTASEELQSMIESSLASNNDSLLKAWENRESQWQEQFAKLSQKQGRSSGISQAQLAQLAEQIRQENYELMIQLTDWSQNQQKEYVGEVVNELTAFLDEQRIEDMSQIGDAFQTMRFQTEKSEQLIAELAQYYLDNKQENTD